MADERAIRRYMPIEEVPGLVIDGHLVSVATVPDHDTIRRWLSEAEPARQVGRP
jgi:hypothetical protein